MKMEKQVLLVVLASLGAVLLSPATPKPENHHWSSLGSGVQYRYEEDPDKSSFPEGGDLISSLDKDGTTYVYSRVGKTTWRLMFTQEATKIIVDVFVGIKNRRSRLVDVKRNGDEMDVLLAVPEGYRCFFLKKDGGRWRLMARSFILQSRFIVLTDAMRDSTVKSVSIEDGHKVIIKRKDKEDEIYIFDAAKNEVAKQGGAPNDNAWFDWRPGYKE